MVVLFDGTFDGFLCVVYAVYYEKIAPTSIQVEGQEQLALGEPPLYIDSNATKATKVFAAVRNKISEESASYIFHAFLSEDEGRFMAILSYIRLGFSVGHMVDSHLHENFVRLVHKLYKYVLREAHLLYGFCRFAETTQNAYYCEVNPKNDVLELLAQHFSQRLMDQAWVIHDKTRNKAAIYDKNSIVITIVPAENANVTFTADEEEIQGLWVAFFRALAISERKNPKLQKQLLPLYFRQNMTEFKVQPD
ncbi:MAG: TIGR03915 family putative DNA repair protein [Defluviitaleaceae bacterium]|nr:TIGR03915 family putative DNA repair protein [Defluviitaleaceae bacterium]